MDRVSDCVGLESLRRGVNIVIWDVSLGCNVECPPPSNTHTQTRQAALQLEVEDINSRINKAEAQELLEQVQARLRRSRGPAGGRSAMGEVLQRGGAPRLSLPWVFPDDAEAAAATGKA